MKRLNMADINTPEHYTNLYYGERRHELKAYPEIMAILRMATSGYDQIWDVGCGIGEYAPALISSIKLVGTELSEKAIEEAKATGLYDEVKQWRVGTPDPFPYDTFNLIWAGEIIEHLEFPEQLIGLIEQKLEPYGKLILTTPFEDSIQCPEHLWAFGTDDLRKLLSPLKINGIFRFCHEPVERWEHLLVIAQKE